MTESIGEMIIPGTYIEVRAEGLIGVGGISTGTIGVVGTANRGPVGEAVVLGSYAEALSTFGNYDAWPADAATPRLTLTRALEQIFRGGGSSVIAVRVAALPNDVPAMRSMVWRVRAGNNATIFSLTATSPGTWANAIVAELTPPEEAGGEVTLTLTLGAVRETFRGTTAGVLAQEINDASNFVTASAPGTPASVPASIVRIEEAERGGPDGAAVTATHIAAGLAVLATQPVNIVNVAGLGADAVFGVVLGHLEATETEGNERIAIMGVRGDTLAAIAQDAQNVSNGRAVLVAPGIVGSDAASNGVEVDLPAAYAASLIAGRLVSIAAHVSLTNKDVAANGLTREYTRAEQKQLLLNRIMVLTRNLGIRALRGITTDTGPFRQISVRRIVDYAKAGVRLGSNPYIGRLNNSRVRAALKATLDGFLAQMVLDEMLISYELEVTATRAQEIAGVAAVTLTLRPTFSIDFIRVTMILE
ncbi:MAG: phage tail sheath subtilisin-like domain-containing protein [Propylenella sp.]